MNPSDLPLKIHNTEQVRALDRCAIEAHGIDGFELMQKAARFAFHCLLKRWPDTARLLVLCGGGNNAGDGYVMAALAAARKIETMVLWLSAPEQLRGDAAQAWARAQRSQVPCAAFSVERLHQWLAADSSPRLLVDALLGTGLRTQVRADYAAAINACNQVRSKQTPVFAVDLPSGLCADTGRALGSAIEADATATFIGIKTGLMTGRGPQLSGELFFSDLDLPQAVLDAVPCSLTRLDLKELLTALPRRDRDSHKGRHGHLLLLGGNRGFGGAIMLAAQAAARCGAGLISVGTRAEHRTPLLARQPELMVHEVRDRTTLHTLLTSADALVVGPGLGQDGWAELLLREALTQRKPTVLDADALNLLARHPDWLPEPRDHLVLTPHPGEAARLLGTDTDTIQGDRPAAARALQQRWGGSIVLKGAGSLVCHPDQALMLCPYGNPGMASAGMGDVLSGIVGGLLAQSLQPRYAVNLAVTLHSAAADILAASAGERGLLAGDLIPVARRLLNGLDS